MNIRLATPQDKQQILTLLEEFSSMFGGTLSAASGDIYDEIVSRQDTMIFVADDEGRLVGLTTFYLLPNIRHGWHRGHIEDFFVSQAVRHKGVGSQIFDAIKVYCHAHNIKVIKLDSGNELTSAHQFYEKNGGKTTERFFRFDLE